LVFGICYIAQNTEGQIKNNLKKRDTDLFSCGTSPFGGFSDAAAGGGGHDSRAVPWDMCCTLPAPAASNDVMGNAN
jgi:hypothetical protein